MIEVLTEVFIHGVAPILAIIAGIGVLRWRRKATSDG